MTFWIKTNKKLEKYRINFCLTMLKSKLQLSGVDDNYKAIRKRKDVVP